MMRAALASLILAMVAAAMVAAGDPHRGTPLWPGARYTQEDRDRAVARGLRFMFDVAHNPDTFREYGHDLLSAFYNISITSRSGALRSTAWTMGHERALAWRRLHPTVPPGADINDFCDLVFGHDAARRLGSPDPSMQAALARSSTRFTVYDYLLFDPVVEPPPSDLPDECSKCGQQNARGATVCSRCGARLQMRNRYDLYQDALITTYSGDRAGIKLGAHYRDVLKWAPQMRPYPPRLPDNKDDYYGGVYSATHLIYTYNDYSQFRVSPDCFPLEYRHLEDNLRQAVAEKDPETMGEYLDTLRAFGLTLDNQLIRTGFEYLLGAQNRDGSWGDIHDPDPYGRYHPTWTAVDGLRDYGWTRVLPCPAP